MSDGTPGDGRGGERDGADGPGETDDRDRIARLDRHLDATAELPVSPTASPYLGEAAAVAADLAARDAPPAVVRERAEHVRDLLAEAPETGNDEADAHVARARELAAALAGGDADADETGRGDDA